MSDIAENFASDIIIEHELNPSRNQRVFIFHGDSEIDGINRNGEIDIVSSEALNESYAHMVYFRKYFEEYYQDDKTLQEFVNKSAQPGIPIYLMLKYYNDFIFTETTRENDKKRYGMFYLPRKITQEQKELIDLYSKHFECFDDVYISGDYFINEGHFLDNRISKVVNGNEWKDIFDYMEVSNNKYTH